jgi:putative heme-binding domain-containing protein
LLAELARGAANRPFLTGAILSSLSERSLQNVWAAVSEGSGATTAATLPPEFTETVLRMALAEGNTDVAAQVLSGMLARPSGRGEAEPFASLASLLDTLEGADAALSKLAADEHMRAAVQQFAPVFAEARQVAVDAHADETRRAAAARLLGRGPDDEGRRRADVKVLAGLLTAQSPEAVQTAALETLGKLGTPESLSAVLAGWRNLGPAQRATAAGVLMDRPAWTDAFLAAMEKGKIRATDLDATRRQRLLQSETPDVRDRAKKLFASVVNPDRQKVIDAYAPAAKLPGDVKRGAERFKQTCSACHRLENIGNSVGPDLASLSDKSPEYLMVQILDPNRGVEAKFTDYVLQTKSGQTLSGIISGETGGSVTLLMPESKSQTILRADIKVLRSTGLSLMPENLEAGMTPQDLADLLAFVRTAGSAAPPTTRP